MFWKKHVAKLEEKKQEKLAKATKLTEKNHVENKEGFMTFSAKPLKLKKEH